MGSRYRPTPTGALRVGEPQPNTGGQFSTDTPTNSPKAGSGQSRRSIDNNVGGVYSAFLKKDGPRGDKVYPDIFPEVKWISVAEGTRLPGDMEDRASRYLDDQNRLLINADLRAFDDMIKYWQKQYAKHHAAAAGIASHIVESVHNWFEQALVETVIGLQALKGSREWNIDQLTKAMSDEALTAVVMQRYHPYNCIKRELGTKIASLG